MTNKLPESAGVLRLQLSQGEVVEIKPTIEHYRTYREIMERFSGRKSTSGMYEALESFAIELFEYSMPAEDREKIEHYVVSRLNEIATELQIAFRWAKREDIERAREKLFGGAEKNVE